MRAEFVMDTSRDTSELRSALSTWAGEHDGATVGGTGEGTGPVTLTSCG